MQLHHRSWGRRPRRASVAWQEFSLWATTIVFCLAGLVPIASAQEAAKPSPAAAPQQQGNADSAKNQKQQPPPAPAPKKGEQADAPAEAEAKPPAAEPQTPAAAPPPAARADGDDEIDASGDATAAAVNYAARAAAAQARIDGLANEIADEALRGRVAEQWKDALSQWQAAEQAADLLVRRRQTVEGLAARLEAIKAENEALRAKAAAPVDAEGGPSLQELETELREFDRNMPEWTKQLAQRAARMESQAKRLAESAQAAEEAQARLDEKAAPVPDTLPPELKAAVREAQSARRRADQEIVAGSEYFRNIQEPLAQLDVAEHDLLSRRLEFGKARREQLSKRIAELRREEAEALRRESEAAAAQALDALPYSFREVDKENRELSQLLDRLLEREKERAKYLQSMSGQIQTLQTEYDRIHEQLESGSGGQTLGAYLWSRRNTLQRETYQSAQNREKLAEPSDAGLTPGNLDEMRRRGPRLEQELAAFSSRPDIAALPEAKREQLLEQARKMLDYHSKVVASLAEYVSRQSTMIVDMDTADKDLRRIAARYSTLAERYVLHLPGSPPLWRIPFAETVRRVWNDLGRRAPWRNAGEALLQGLVRSPWLLLFLILSIAPTAILRTLARWFKPLNLSAKTPVAATSRGLLWRAGTALLRSYPAPLALFAMGGAIWKAAGPGGTAAAVGEAFMATVLPWLLISLWRRFCYPDSLFEIYARMPRELADRLRGNLGAVLCVGMPLWMVTWFAQSRTEPAAYQALGCVLSTLLAAVFLGFWHARMRPAVLLRDVEVKRPLFWQALHVILTALGLFWFGMSLMGYTYGALLVVAKAAVSGLIVTAILVAALNWSLRLARARERQRARAIMYYRFGEERRRQREERQRATGKAGGGDTDLKLVGHGELDALESPAVAAAAVSIPNAVEKELEDSLGDARRLVHWLFIAAVAAVLLVQWSDILPLREWCGQLTLLARDNADGLTLKDIISAVAGGLLCYAVAIPLGAWINLSFFNWNPAERGTRVATAALIRYLVVGAGVIWAAQELGMAWSDAQWLVAALSVGLGFGLQEIILNFVSGIILLFERPVRVGDMVSTGGAEGTISRINIRTTTLVDANRRELIIPNKELVTGRVINWTLSDSVTRLVIPVGVAYGSDLELVQRILIAAANATDEVLDDPPPSVFFTEMADSSLNFELRVYTARLEDRTPAQHQLRLNINRMFLENDIEVPFPQLDVHIRPQD